MKQLNVIIVCLFLTVIIGAFLLYPKYQDWAGLRNQIKEKENELQTKEQYLSDLSNASQGLKEYQEELSVIDAALPSSSSLPALFNFLQGAASQNGLIVKKTSFSSDINPQGLKETKIDLKLAGVYSGLKSFVSALEKSARMIELESVSFSTPEKGEIFDFDLKVKVFSY